MSIENLSPTREEQLEKAMFEIIRRRDDDIHYNRPEMVRDIEALFGLTAVRNAVRLWKQSGDAEGAMRVVAEAVRDER